jgi:hypothetical protein
MTASSYRASEVHIREVFRSLLLYNLKTKNEKDTTHFIYSRSADTQR